MKKIFKVICSSFKYTFIGSLSSISLLIIYFRITGQVSVLDHITTYLFSRETIYQNEFDLLFTPETEFNKQIIEKVHLKTDQICKGFVNNSIIPAEYDKNSVIGQVITTLINKSPEKIKILGDGRIYILFDKESTKICPQLYDVMVVRSESGKMGKRFLESRVALVSKTNNIYIVYAKERLQDAADFWLKKSDVMYMEKYKLTYDLEYEKEKLNFKNKYIKDRMFSDGKVTSVVVITGIVAVGAYYCYKNF